ncbi:MAG: TIGR01841 family phasin [Alphaproteobacteria bacterium]|nr:TIGR01841 family phasin [Alphaproteobacteria bacterium]
MTKAKTAADKAAATADFAIANGAEAIRAGFDKAVKNYDAVLGYGKDTAEAVMKSATVAGKGVESISNEIYAYSKQSLEDSITVTKAVMSSKSLHEAFEYQSDFAKSAFESYIGGLTKFGELFTVTAKDSFAPLQGRVEAWLDVVQTTRA